MSLARTSLPRVTMPMMWTCMPPRVAPGQGEKAMYARERPCGAAPEDARHVHGACRGRGRPPLKGNACPGVLMLADAVCAYIEPWLG